MGLRLQPFIATLATLAAYRGLVFAISGRQLVPALSTTPITDPWIVGLETYFDVGAALGLARSDHAAGDPAVVRRDAGAARAVRGAAAVHALRPQPLAVGGNPEAARLAGIAVARHIVLAYALSGLCAGVAALLLVARLTTATEALGSGLELTAIAAAVIGGVSLRGGSGTMFGPVLGAFLLGVVLLGLTLDGISQFVQQILTGAILLGAVAHARWLARRRDRGRPTFAGA